MEYFPNQKGRLTEQPEIVTEGAYPDNQRASRERLRNDLKNHLKAYRKDFPEVGVPRSDLERQEGSDQT